MKLGQFFIFYKMCKEKCDEVWMLISAYFDSFAITYPT